MGLLKDFTKAVNKACKSIDRTVNPPAKRTHTTPSDFTPTTYQKKYGNPPRAGSGQYARPKGGYGAKRASFHSDDWGNDRVTSRK